MGGDSGAPHLARRRFLPVASPEVVAAANGRTKESRPSGARQLN